MEDRKYDSLDCSMSQYMYFVRDINGGMNDRMGFDMTNYRICPSDDTICAAIPDWRNISPDEEINAVRLKENRAITTDDVMGSLFEHGIMDGDTSIVFMRTDTELCQAPETRLTCIPTKTKIASNLSRFVGTDTVIEHDECENHDFNDEFYESIRKRMLGAGMVGFRLDGLCASFRASVAMPNSKSTVSGLDKDIMPMDHGEKSDFDLFMPKAYAEKLSVFISPMMIWPGTVAKRFKVIGRSDTEFGTLSMTFCIMSPESLFSTYIGLKAKIGDRVRLSGEFGLTEEWLLANYLKG